MLSLDICYIGSAGPLGGGPGCIVAVVEYDVEATALACDVSDADDKSSVEAVGGNLGSPASLSISSENCSYATPLRAKASTKGSKPTVPSLAKVTFCCGRPLLELRFRGSASTWCVGGDMLPPRTHLSVVSWMSLGEPPSLGGFGDGLFLKNATTRSKGDLERDCGDLGLAERGLVGVRLPEVPGAGLVQEE